MPFIVIFVASWIAFFLFADLSKWRRYLPACFLAMILSISSDLLVMYYPLWTYHDPTGLLRMIGHTHVLDDFGIYPVVTYLFLQYYPAAKTRPKKFLYFVAWTTFAILFEFLHFHMGWMKHLNGWSHLKSYGADWGLLYLFLVFYKVYNRPTGSPHSSLAHTEDSPVPNYVYSIRHLGLELEFIAEAEDYEVYLLEVHPGGEIISHWHHNSELCVVLKGEVEFTIGDTTEVYSKGNLINLPQAVVHRGQNTTSEPALLLCTFWPAGLRQSLQARPLDQLASTVPPLQL